MKTTFSYFPGMFENPAPAKYHLKKTKSKILSNINYIRMRRKIIDDYLLKYLNDLFGIKLIILWFQLNVATFWICMDITFFGIWVDFNNFFLIDATDRSKISSHQKHLFFAASLCPLSFFCKHSLYQMPIFNNKHYLQTVTYFC